MAAGSSKFVLDTNCFTAMGADLPIFIGDVEIDPGMRIDEIQAGEHTLELDLLAAIEGSPAVMGTRELGERHQHDDERGFSNHARSPVHPVSAPRAKASGISRARGRLALDPQLRASGSVVSPLDVPILPKRIVVHGGGEVERRLEFDVVEPRL